MTKTLDNAVSLSIFYLKKVGVLTPGMSSTLTWSRRGAVIQRTKIFVDEDGIDMVGGKIYFERTPCHFGGHRLWLKCPMCNGRSGVLYGISFVCKKCIGLNYGSQHETGLERSQRRLKRFKRQAFGTASPWVKPKGQHSHTYLHNLGEYCDLTEKQNSMYMAAISSAKARLNCD